LPTRPAAGQDALPFFPADRLARRAIAMDGACTGEHGVGQKKIAFLEVERDAGALELMRRVKLAFDPQNLFDPGKIFREL
jgi:D-lactate dehydrogenase (cytochrome)